MSLPARVLVTLLLTTLLLITLGVSGCGPGDVTDESPDFVILAQSMEGYAQARAGQKLRFPQDHGAHEDFRIEWWYLTANLEDPEGRPHGVQWTLFRVALEPPGVAPAPNAWSSHQMYMAHMAITTPERHLSFQRYARGGDHGGETRAGVRANPFSAWLDDWMLNSTGPDWLPLEVRARQGSKAFHLQLESDLGIVLQGDNGFSRKHANGSGSYYYSHPFLKASGTLEVDSETNPVTGSAWLDREWSSQFLQEDQSGWDWFSLHLDSGEKLMLFQLRQHAGSPGGTPFRHGVLIAPDGSRTELEPDRIGLEVLEREEVAGRRVPVGWRVELPQIQRELEVNALLAEQWMDVDFPYWEGAVTVSGNGPPNSGVGYLEMTGYPIE